MSKPNKLLLFGLVSLVVTTITGPFGLLIGIAMLIVSYRLWATPDKGRGKILGWSIASGFLLGALWVALIIWESQETPEAGFAIVATPHIVLMGTQLFFAVLAAHRELKLSARPSRYPFVVLAAVLAVVVMIFVLS